MWDLLRPGIEPISPALTGGFFTTEPPGKPWEYIESQVILRKQREHQANKLFINSTKTELASPCVMCQERNKRDPQTFSLSHTHTHVCVLIS